MNEAACAQLAETEDWERLSAMFHGERQSGQRNAETSLKEDQALRVCAGCPVRRPCLLFGITDEFGIYGGTTAAERRAVNHLPIPERARALDELFYAKVGRVLLPGESPA